MHDETAFSFFLLFFLPFKYSIIKVVQFSFFFFGILGIVLPKFSNFVRVKLLENHHMHVSFNSSTNPYIMGTGTSIKSESMVLFSLEVCLQEQGEVAIGDYDTSLH